MLPKTTELRTQFITGLSKTPLMNTFLLSELDGEMGQLCTRTKELLWEASKDDPQPSVLDDLFESAYSYGLQFDRLNLAPDLREEVVWEAYETLPSVLIVESSDGRTYLPRFPMRAIMETVEDPANYDWAKYACMLGLCAGIVFSDEKASIGVSTEAGAMPERQEKSVAQVREELISELLVNPARFIRELLPGVQSIEEFERCKFVLDKLIPDYYRSRIEELIKIKKKNKVSYTVDSGYQVYSRWAKFWEDPKADKVETLFPDLDLSDKGQFFAKASELAEIELVREVLLRDIKQGDIPDEIAKLVDYYLLDCMSVEQEPYYGDFSEFIRSQYYLSSSIEQIEAYMRETPYWVDSGRRQIVTPDRLKINPQQLEDIKRIGAGYADFMQKVTRLYADSLGSDDSERKKLVQKLEGGLPAESVEFLRKLSKLSAGKPIDSLRFDLVPSDNSFSVCEAQLISGGTPPAVLYREAFEMIESGGFVGEGVLPAFIKRLKAQSDEPMLAIVYSKRPYSSDISKTTSWAGNRAFEQVLIREGIKVRTVFSSELKRRDDGNWYFKEGEYSDIPITTAYNRTDVVSEGAARLLEDDSYRDIQLAMANGEIDAFPPPMPILFGKGIYALIWDKESDTLLNEAGISSEQINFLRSCTPETYWVTQETVEKSDVLGNPRAWVRKGSYQHATQGLVMGADYPGDLRRQVLEDIQLPYSATIQRYVESDQPVFRVPLGENIIGGKHFRLRIEPTYIDGRLAEIFLTGNPDRLVHGRETSIMSLAKINS